MSIIAMTTSTFNAPATLPAFTRANEEELGAHIVSSSSILGSEDFDPEAMTPDALLVYLSTRLGSIDDQMDTILGRQRTSEKVRSEIGEIQKVLSSCATDPNEKQDLVMSEQAKSQIETHIANIATQDPELASDLNKALHEDGQILSGFDCRYSTDQLNHTKDYLNLVTKDIESGAQMDMIRLQSMMGARQTAIQLSTNLVSALSESQKAIVSNIR